MREEIWSVVGDDLVLRRLHKEVGCSHIESAGIGYGLGVVLVQQLEGLVEVLLLVELLHELHTLAILTLSQGLSLQVQLVQQMRSEFLQIDVSLTLNTVVICLDFFFALFQILALGIDNVFQFGQVQAILIT